MGRVHLSVIMHGLSMVIYAQENHYKNKIYYHMDDNTIATLV